MDRAEERRSEALSVSIRWAASFKNSTPQPSVVIDAAKKFEGYLKGDS